MKADRSPSASYARTIKIVWVVLWILATGANAMALDGSTALSSDYAVRETVQRLEAAVKDKGMTIFARIDHAANAAGVGLPLRPTELLIFGNAKAGTLLMQAAPAMGIDLPLKVLVFEDPTGKVWLSYYEPRWLAQRHELGNGSSGTVDAMEAALHAVAMMATRKPATSMK